MKNKFLKIKKNKGMTLVELLVVSIIFIIVSSISIFNYNKFNSSISIQNLADDLALSIRKVQGYAIGARGLGLNFDYSYGVNMSIGEQIPYSYPLSSSKSIVIFTDVSGNGQYDYTVDSESFSCGTPSSQNECLEYLTIKNNDKISKIEICNGSDCDIMGINSSINVLFKRPNPEAVFCYKESLSSSCIASVSHVIIYIENGVSQTENKISKSVTIWSTGQIYIN